ncbi:MAG: hypothetical protein N4A35_10835 [Flavobacteriales bacterium]|nr:hypothetical protein [Flavobacteriales bacterium]
MNKIIAILIFLGSIFVAVSQETKTYLDVKITSVEKMRKRLKNTAVVLYKNEQKVDSVNLTNGRYKLNLDTGNVYKVEFKKPLYVTKFIVLNTKEAPKKYNKNTKLKIDIGLFHQKDDLNVDFLKKEPIGYARYDFVTDKMMWDEAYLQMMKGKIVRATLNYAKSKNY